MKSTLKRKQFILPQAKLTEVKRLLKARTETEAVILSLEEMIRRKRAGELIDLAGKVHFDLTHRELKRQRMGN
jgi:hypothetical protein